VQAGMRPMFQDGLAKVRAGVTTVEEVLRVTREVE
jgi:type II secretory ATPase GspE/PulE/Tfp pilus assembly ATPase PilB-like protein